MPHKKYIEKYLSFRFRGRKSPVRGILLSYSDEYTLIRDCPDFEPDGYIIFRNHQVSVESGDTERLAQRILKLKGYSHKEETLAPIDTLDNILCYLNDNYQLIGLENLAGNELDVVSYLGKKGKKYLFTELTTMATWRYQLELTERDCRFISFNNTYLNSLKLITKFKKKPTTSP